MGAYYHQLGCGFILRMVQWTRTANFFCHSALMGRMVGVSPFPLLSLISPSCHGTELGWTACPALTLNTACNWLPHLSFLDSSAPYDPTPALAQTEEVICVP